MKNSWVYYDQEAPRKSNLHKQLLVSCLSEQASSPSLRSSSIFVSHSDSPLSSQIDFNMVDWQSPQEIAHDGGL